MYFCLLEKLSVYSDLSILLVIGGSWSGWVVSVTDKWTRGHQ